MTKLQKGVNDLETRCKQNNREDLLEEWSDKNTIKPFELTYGSHKTIIWHCHNGHEREAHLDSRTTKHTHCPYCINKRIKKGENDALTYCKNHNLLNICNEFDTNKNKIQLNQISPHSKKKFWRKCPLGHSYYSSLEKRVNRGSGCPYCAKRKVLAGFNDLKTWCKNNNREDLLTERSNKNTYKTEELSYTSPRSIVWQCKKGHEWSTKLPNRTVKNSGCPYCSNQKALTGFNDLETWAKKNNRDDILQDWDYNLNCKKPSEVLPGTKKKYWFICPKCHKSYKATLNNKTQKFPTMCPYCSNRKSIIELTLYEVIKKYIDCNVKSGEKFWNYEVDIYLPDSQIYLEYDGVYFHNNDGILSDYELKKNQIFEQHKIKLIRIKETREVSKNLKEENYDFLQIYYIMDNYNKLYWETLSIILNKIFNIKISAQELKDIYAIIKINKNRK